MFLCGNKINFFLRISGEISPYLGLLPNKYPGIYLLLLWLKIVYDKFWRCEVSDLDVELLFYCLWNKILECVAVLLFVE